MPHSAASNDESDRRETGSSPARPGTTDQPLSDSDAQRALDHGDKDKIDRKLDELDVSTTETGKDQTAKPDTEGSNSSSKNLDEQGS